MDMTVTEYLNFVYELKKIKRNKNVHIEEIMEHVRINDVKNRLIKNLSKGYRQRVGLAQAILGGPEVLILDEPTIGLDPKQIIEIRNLIKELGKEHTVILSSHILPEISAVCERVIIINKGKIVAIDTPENLSKRLSNENKILVRIAGEEPRIIKTVKELEGVKNVEVQGYQEKGTADYVIESHPDVDIRKPLFFALSDKEYPILMLKSMGLTLEEIFLQVTNDIVIEEDEDLANMMKDEQLVESEAPENKGDNDDVEGSDFENLEIEEALDLKRDYDENIDNEIKEEE
jgi:ABC-2 type transport system ATP-binding protein